MPSYLNVKKMQIKTKSKTFHRATKGIRAGHYLFVVSSVSSILSALDKKPQYYICVYLND